MDIQSDNIKVFDPDKMRRLRKAAKLSISEVARRAGVSRVSASTWESGGTVPCFESMQLLALALGVKKLGRLLKERERD